MPPPLYVQNVIAFVWDYDRTLIPGNQQDPIFEEYGVDPGEFWAEVEGLVGYYATRGVRASRDLVYLSHMITYVENGLFPNLSRRKLAELGARVETAPGIPEFFASTRRHVQDNPDYSKEGISVEHYVVSTGIVPMILGNKIADEIDGVWANDFIEEPAPPGYLGHLDMTEADVPISGLGYTMDNTAKTKAIFEINKGVNKNPSIDVNSRLPEEHRRVPLRHMIYVADGPSDVPVFSILNRNGGKTLGVYTTEPANNFRQVKSLQEQGRIQGMAKADFRPGEAAYLWLMDSLDQIADEIVTARQIALSQIPQAPGHV